MRYLQSMILAILFVLALILQFTQYGDYDLWWHLRRGQHVYETGHFYTVDTFSYTYAGQPQYCGEWLADLMFFGFYHVGGLVGLNVLKSLIILGTLAFIFLTLQKSFQEKTTGFYATVITILAILFAIRFRLFIRPYIFGYLFFAIYLWLLASFAKERCQWQLYLLPVIQILWSNMSMSAVFGPMLLAFFTLGAMCDRSLRQTIRGLAGIFAITLIASLISPEIYHPYLKIAQATLQTNMGRIGEFQPLSWQLLWGYGWRYTFVYQCLVIGILLYFVCCQGWRQVFHVLLITTFFVESVRHLRMIDFFALSAAPAFMLAVESGLRASWIRRFVERPAGGIALAILLVLLIPVALLHPSYQFGTGVKKDTFPEGALQFLEREKIEGRVFNSYGFGGYIIWNTPQRQVFIDGRHLHLYSHDFLTKYDRMVEDAKTWQEAQAKWGFDYAIVEYDTKTRIFPLHLNQNPEWALVYWDNIACVYLKRQERFSKIIEQYEYKIIKPNFYDFSYLDNYLRELNMTIFQQVARDATLNPENQEPRLARILLLSTLGTSTKTMMAELEVCLSLQPDLAMEHSAMATLLLSTDKLRALAELDKALALDPNDLQALALRKVMKKSQ